MQQMLDLRLRLRMEVSQDQFWLYMDESSNLAASSCRRRLYPSIGRDGSRGDEVCVHRSRQQVAVLRVAPMGSLTGTVFGCFGLRVNKRFSARPVHFTRKKRSMLPFDHGYLVD